MARDLEARYKDARNRVIGLFFVCLLAVGSYLRDSDHWGGLAFLMASLAATTISVWYFRRVSSERRRTQPVERRHGRS